MKSGKKTTTDKKSESKGKKGTLRDLKPNEKKTDQVSGGRQSGKPEGRRGFNPEMYCDQALKENFGTVDRRETLERLAQIPIATWNYKDEDPAVRHMSPTAQDFAVAFPLGATNTRINVIDATGVAFAAIQALREMAEENERELKKLRLEVKRLRRARG